MCVKVRVSVSVPRERERERQRRARERARAHTASVNANNAGVNDVRVNSANVGVCVSDNVAPAKAGA